MKKIKVEYFVCLPDDIATDLMAKNAHFPPYQITVAGKPYEVKMIDTRMEEAVEADFY